MFNVIKNKLIVSVQALEDEPLHGSETMVKMARAAKMGGACAFRVQGISDITSIMDDLKMPVIGIIKKNYGECNVFITPTLKEVNELLSTKCEMIALDATKRARPNDEKLVDLVKHIKDHNVYVMADISTYEEAIYAEEIGCDCVSTTLCGYTSYSENLEGPNLALINKLVSNLKIPVIVEGKINTPADLALVASLNVYSYVVGSAITRPQLITKTFSDVLK